LYEGELGIVMAAHERRARGDAARHIFGYTCVNDVRDSTSSKDPGVCAMDAREEASTPSGVRSLIETEVDPGSSS